MSTTHAALRGTLAMLTVGTLVAVSARLGDYPVFTGQAIRYTLGALALFAVLAVRRPERTPPRSERPSPRGADASPATPAHGSPSGPGSSPDAPAPASVAASGKLAPKQWLLLAALSLIGLVFFNVCIVVGNHYASPATIGTIIGASPIVMGVLAPLLARRRPTPRLLLAALVVTTGTAVATGLGGASPLGVLLAVGALIGEVSFSLLAVPLLPTLGALRVSAYSAALAVPMLLTTGFVTGEPHRLPTGPEALALGYLGIVVTAGAFLLWYSALPRLGADRAGLLAGIMPIGAVATMVVLGIGTPRPGELAGGALVMAGILWGMWTPRTARVPAPA